MNKTILILTLSLLSMNSFAGDKPLYPTLISPAIINVTETGMKIDPAQEAFYNLIKTQDHETYTSTVDKSFIQVNKKDGKITDILENQQNSSKLGQIINVDSSGKLSSLTRCDSSTNECITFNNKICTGLNGFDKKLAACTDFIKLTGDLSEQLRAKEMRKIEDKNIDMLNDAVSEAKKIDSKASKFNGRFVLVGFKHNKGSLDKYEDNLDLLHKLIDIQKRCDSLRADGYLSKQDDDFKSSKSKDKSSAKEAK